MSFKRIQLFIISHKKQSFLSVIITVLLIIIGASFSTIARASFGTWGDNSLINACEDSRGRVTLVAPGTSCNSGETEVTWLKDVDAGTGLSISRSSSGVTLSLSNTATAGWTASSDTWTYASSNSFTISGSDKTVIFTKGTRIKASNNSTMFYGTVASSSYSSSTTTVTLVGNSDYSLSNSAITNPYYSYQANPQGYPGWFNYTPTWGGFSSNPTSVIARYYVVGNSVNVHLHCGGGGTSNATSLTVTAPIAAAQNYWAGLVDSYDNSNQQNNPGVAITTSGSSTLTIQKDLTNSPWTASNVKCTNFSINYEF